MMQNKISIIPQPNKIESTVGAFILDADTRFLVPPNGIGVATLFASMLRKVTGFAIPVEMMETDSDVDASAISLLASAKHEIANEEGYLLEVNSRRINIHASSPVGWFYGLQSLRQLLPIEVETDTHVQGIEWSVPGIRIQDSPRFRWRGLHLDVGRHMFPVAFIKKFLDLMALHKLNVFHWHLTEDQGWRIEIKRYPRLTEIGSQRNATPIPANRKQSDGQPYGGYYTQDEVREVVAYAAERFIIVVPEIEMPGHALAALTSYPELGCVGNAYDVWTQWGVAEDVFCAGNEDTYTFLENVLDEVMELFPSEYIHIGGDECPKVRWKECPKCQRMIEREGLTDEDGLQSYVIRRMERYLNQRGRRLVGWDEILEGGLAPNATVMSWRGITGGIQAAKAGHDVVMSPTSHCYFDYYQSTDQSNEPPAIGGHIPLEQVYEFDPVAGIPSDNVQQVIGGQGNLWTEYIPTAEQVEYMVYPRASALAEVLWTEASGRNYDEFYDRLQSHSRRLRKLNVNYRDPFA